MFRDYQNEAAEPAQQSPSPFDGATLPARVPVLPA